MRKKFARYAMPWRRAISSHRTMAPTFDAVAGTPGMNERALVVWLQSSDHGSMPNLMLASEDRDDVVAYIMSLRAQK